MENLKKLLGQKIKETRCKRGLSQQQLAELINIDQRNLSNIECGNTFPTKSLINISQILNISLPELFDFDYLQEDEFYMKNYISEKIDNLNTDNLQIVYRLIKFMQ